MTVQKRYARGIRKAAKNCIAASFAEWCVLLAVVKRHSEWKRLLPKHKICPKVYESMNVKNRRALQMRFRRGIKRGAEF